MASTTINVKSMDEPTITNMEVDDQPVQTTVHNMFYESDDDEPEGTNLDDDSGEVVGDGAVAVPIGGGISELEDSCDEEDPQRDNNYLNNKELFAQLPSFTDAARSLHTAATVKKTIRRRMTKRQLNKTISEKGDGTDGTGPSSSQAGAEMEGEGSMEVIRSLGAPMGQRKTLRRNIHAQSARKSRVKLSCWKLFKLRLAMSWKLFKDKIGEFLLALQLWRSPMKEVEGNFGNGVLSYFLFLRSLFLLNIFIFCIELLLVVPQELVNRGVLKDYYSLNQSTSKYLIGTTNLTRQTPPDYVTNMSASSLVLDFITGQGWINTTIMYYSNYHGEIVIGSDKLIYNMPLGYLMVGGAYMVGSFLIMVHNFSERFTESIMESTDTFQSYCNKVFASWDYCITNDQAAALKKNVIYQDFVADLEEEKRLERIKNRNRWDKAKIYSIRALINFLVIALLGGSIYAIYATVQISDAAQDVDAAELKDLNNFVAILERWASSLCISGLNIILPTLFEFLTGLEQWSPSLSIVMSLFRSVLLKLASLIVLIVTLYVNSAETLENDCSQCWENKIAAQMFNLIIVDFLVICAVTILVETGRKYVSIYLKCGTLNLGEKIGRPEFQIPKNILDLVYGQALIWLGTFFAPLMPVLGIIKLFVIFYVKKISLMYNCKSSSKSFQGARSNYFITLLLLLTFLLCTVAIGFGVAQMKVSSFGPYANNPDTCPNKHMIDIIDATIDRWPVVIREILDFLKTAVFIIPVLIVTFLLLYYYHAMTTAHEKMIELLQAQLKIEGQDKRFLMNRLVEINNNLNKNDYGAKSL